MNEDIKSVVLGSENQPMFYKDEKNEVISGQNDSTYMRIPTLYEGTREDIQERVYGMYARGLPTQGSLNILNAILGQVNINIDADKDYEDNAELQKRTMASLVIGDPGGGKTYLAKLAGKFIHKEGGIYVNCKGMDLKELFSQTILDDSNIGAERHAIEARLTMYNKFKYALSEETVDALKKMFNTGMTTDEDGLLKIDWTKAMQDVGMSGGDSEKQFTSLLKAFCNENNIDYSVNSSGVGFIQVDGPAVKAIESGRPLILDEINRGKDTDFLLPFLDFVNGSYDTFSLKAANGRIMNLNRKTMPRTFMMTALMNPEASDMGVIEKLSKPFKDRMNIYQMADFKGGDFTDMICTNMTSVPMSILQNAYSIKSKEELVESCKDIRYMGLSKSEIASIPADQMLYIENADKFLKAARVMGSALANLYELKKQAISKKPIGVGEVRCDDTILKNHIAKQTLSFRTLEKDILAEARNYVPKKNVTTGNPFLRKNYSSAEPTGKYTFKQRMANFGEGVEKAFEKLVLNMFTHPDADPIKTKEIIDMAQTILADHGIGDAEPSYELRKTGDSIVPLRDLLNFSNTEQASPEAKRLQGIVCEVLRSQGIKNLPTDDDQIIDSMIIDNLLRTMSDEAYEKTDNLLGDEIVSINETPNGNDLFSEGMLVTTWGSAFIGKENEEALLKSYEGFDNQTFGLDNSDDDNIYGVTVPVEGLIRDELFLTALTSDLLKDRNMQNLWSNTNSFSLNDVDENIKDILSGKSSTGLAFNSIHTKHKDTYTILDIIKNDNTDKVLIVGDEISDKLVKLLKSKQITYVNRGDSEACSSIKNWLEDVSSSDIKVLEDAICQKNGTFVRDTSEMNIDKLLTTNSEDRSLNNVSQLTNVKYNKLSKGIDYDSADNDQATGKSMDNLSKAIVDMINKKGRA